MDSYLGPVSFEQPGIFEAAPAIDAANDCGENLEYDAAFIELERTVAGIGDQQYGDTFIPAVAPDWKAVRRQADELLQRSKDLRIVQWLTQAWTQSLGLEGYAKGVALIAGLLDTQWNGLHPRIETGDDGQPSPLSRINALQAFFSQQALGAQVRAATLVRVNNVDLPLRKAAAMLEHSGAHEDSAERQELLAALDAQRTSLDVVGKVLADIENVRSVVSKRLDDAWVPDMAAVEKPLRIVFSALSKSTPPAVASPASQDQRSGPESAAVKVNGSANPAGEIRSREEAGLLLEKVCLYLESREPAHPSSLLIRRAQRLLPMTFYEIIRDMSPEAIPRIDLLAGLGDNA